MNEATTVRIIDSTSNPAPLGLLGFGLTTVLLNLANAGSVSAHGVQPYYTALLAQTCRLKVALASETDAVVVTASAS